MSRRDRPTSRTAGRVAPGATSDAAPGGGHPGSGRPGSGRPGDGRSDGVGPRWSYGARGHALFRSLRQLTARPLASTATLLALGVVLALPALLLFSVGVLDALAARTVGGESLTLYLDPATDDLEGAALTREIADRPGIDRTRYISRDEALATFRENSDVGDALDALGANPLPGAVVVHPDVANLDDVTIGALARSLEALPDVERVQIDLDWVRRLAAAVALIGRIGTLAGGFLVLTALLVITNTIRLELARRRAELEVSHLLGASGLFVHRPTLYTGALYGFLGGLVACVLALVALLLVRAPATELARLYGSGFRLPLPGATELGLVVLVSTLLGLAGAMLTLYGAARQKVPSGP